MTKPASVRIAKRIKVFEPALMRYQHAVERIHLLDLSCTGALAHGANPPAVGTIIRIECKMLTIAARTAWVRGPKYGVTFLTPLCSHDLNNMIAVATAVVPAACPGRSRIGLA